MKKEEEEEEKCVPHAGDGNEEDGKQHVSEGEEEDRKQQQNSVVFDEKQRVSYTRACTRGKKSGATKSLVKKKAKKKHEMGKNKMSKQERLLQLKNTICRIDMKNALNLGKKEREASPLRIQGEDSKRRRIVGGDSSVMILDDNDVDDNTVHDDSHQEFMKHLEYIEEEAKNETFSPP